MIHRQNWIAQQHQAPSHDYTVIGWGDRGFSGRLYSGITTRFIQYDFGTITWSDESNSWAKRSYGWDTLGIAEIPTEPMSSTTAPKLVSATLRGADITLQFDNALSDTLPSLNRFTLKQSNREYQIIDAEIRSFEGVVRLTAEKKLDPTVSLTLDYSDFCW